MTKRDDLYDEARRLYVIHGMTLKAIAERLGVSVRSLQNWSADNRDGKGSWDVQKAQLVDGDAAFHAELMGLGVVVARAIKDDLLQGHVDAKAVANLERIVKVAMNAWKYAQKNPQTKPGVTTREDAMQQIQGKIRERLGLRG